MENKKTRILFLVSGNGGNLVFIHQLSNIFNFEIVGVLSDRSCRALQYALNYKLFNETFLFDRSDIDDNKIIHTIKSVKPDVIVTNIHKVLSKKVCEIFLGRLINLHYSLLPAFKGCIGMEAVKKALELNCQFVGSSCHQVDELVDNGKIISQAIIPVKDKSYKQIESEVFEAGALALLTSILSLTEPILKNNQFQFRDIIVSPANDKLCNKIVNITHIFEKINLFLDV